jgi:predicted ester cyclase
MRNAFRSRMMTVEQNRAAYERFCHEVLLRGNVDAIDDLVDPSVVSHSPFPGQAPGRKGFKDAFAQFRAAFADLEISIRDMVAGGDKVVGYFTVKGVHSGDFMGISATGKTVAYEEMVIVRFANGKIVEHWSVADTLAMMQSLGAVREAPAATEANGQSLPEGQVEQVKAFFARYAERFNRSLAGEKIDAKDVAGSFASHFVEASPVGVNGGKNGLLFRFMIPRGFAHYRKIGTTKMKIADLSVEPLDACHALAKVHWDSRYEKKDGTGDRIEFEVTYFLHFQDGDPKIFAYITGDEERVLREHGLSESRQHDAGLLGDRA